MEKSGTFETLKPEANIFKELEITNPKWWDTVRMDKDLYIHIRKDNYISVYYYGGSVLKIRYDGKEFVAEAHQKYLDNNKPKGKNKKGKDKFGYDKVDLSIFDLDKLKDIKKHIEKIYVKKIEKKNPSEKLIQGKLITGNPEYIDSEFQYNKGTKDLRIDLIELKDGVLSFVELKGVSDSRLRNDKKRNRNIPEIIEQMKKYQIFIKDNEDDIKDYYKKLIEIRQKIGLLSITIKDFTINTTPKLLIADTYKKSSDLRDERIKDIEGLLNKHSIDYTIIKWE